MLIDAKQKGVLRGMGPAGAISALALVCGVLWPLPFMLPAAETAARIARALTWDTVVLAFLVFSIGRLAQHRFFTPDDIDGSGLTQGTDRARVLQAILQNTLEQSVIAVLAHLAWAATMPPGWQGAIPVAVILYAIGRIAFIRGYTGGAGARAFGFAITFYPTVMMTLTILVTLLVRAVS